jgi:hypothetical protein
MSLGLQGLARQVLGFHLDKSASVRRSDWEAATLSPAQVTTILYVTMQLGLFFGKPSSTDILLYVHILNTPKWQHKQEINTLQANNNVGPNYHWSNNYSAPFFNIYNTYQ